MVARLSPRYMYVGDRRAVTTGLPLFRSVRKCSTVSCKISAFSNLPLWGSLAAAGTNLRSSPRDAFILSRRFFSIIPRLRLRDACWQESPPGELQLHREKKGNDSWQCARRESESRIDRQRQCNPVHKYFQTSLLPFEDNEILIIALWFESSRTICRRMSDNINSYSVEQRCIVCPLFLNKSRWSLWILRLLFFCRIFCQG